MDFSVTIKVISTLSDSDSYTVEFSTILQSINKINGLEAITKNKFIYTEFIMKILRLLS